VHTGNHIFFK